MLDLWSFGNLRDKNDVHTLYMAQNKVLRALTMRLFKLKTMVMSDFPFEAVLRPKTVKD